MNSYPVRDPLKDRLMTPENTALIIIDYQPVQINSINSMSRLELTPWPKAMKCIL